MNEVELIGYTGDLRFLVLELHGSAGTRRLRLPVDPDLVATLDEIRDQRDDLPDLEWYAAAVTDGEAGDDPGLAVDEDLDAGGSAAGGEAPESDGPGAVDRPSDGGDPTSEGAEHDDAAGAEGADEDDGAVATGADGASSVLTPAQIQTMLRSGRSVRSVAKAAGTEVEWVERWLPPIIAEREQILREARRLRLHRARLGESRRTLGEAVERNLADRGVDDEEVTWTASRRADGRWTVGVRYRHRGRARSASWTLDREAGTLSAASDLARELGWAPSKNATRGRTRKTAKQARSARRGSKATSKKGTARKRTAKGTSSTRAAAGTTDAAEDPGARPNDGDGAPRNAPTWTRKRG